MQKKNLVFVTFITLFISIAILPAALAPKPPSIVEPTIATDPATNITDTSATIAATFTVGDIDPVEVWFEFDGADTTHQLYSADGTHTEDVTGLSPATNYQYRAVLYYTTLDKRGRIKEHTIFGDMMSFDTTGSAPDTIPPVVTITNPGDGAIVSGIVSITFDATDANGISSKRILIDGVEVSTEFSYSWDTTLETDGSHTILCEATDPSSNTGSDSISVTVDNSVASEHNPILFVHGWSGSASAWDDMRASLISDGWDPNILFAYTFADTGASVGQNVENAQEIDGWVTQILAQTGASKVDLVSHSMGGLSTRYYIKFGAGINTVDDYVCLDSPQHGSDAPYVPLITPDLASDSDVVIALNTGDETPGGVLPDNGPEHIPGDITYTACYATDESGILDGAEIYQFPSVEHNAFRTDPGVYAVVKAAIEDA